MPFVKGKYLIIIAVIMLIADQASKIAIKTTMTIGENISVIGSWFNIHFVENSGAAWGMELGGDWGKLSLSLFRIVACIVLVVYINRLRKRGTATGVLVAFTAIAAGALGNVIDSAFYGLIFSESTTTTVAHLTAFGDGYGTFLHGKVVDMLYFPIIETESFTFFSAIFNLADSYISVALIYLVFFQSKFFSSKSDKKTITQ